MFLLVLSTTLSFISVHSSFLGKQVLKWINRPSEKENKLTTEKSKLKLEQDQLNMTDNFAKYSKIQRRINIIDKELLEYRNEKSNITLQLSLTYGLKFVLGICLAALSIYYRYSPVLKVHSSVDLTPFNHLISYPNESNQVSFHFWVLCCSSIARLIKF
ncbi:hypothetical protein NQ317_012051 [Molorchus minor]|uniref:Guided entry of tail-anchored proteins factor 1 n=1 Tax=Molorchus minor TaxID=1323400 RepID=A0ABQ9K716_9CUCU|nr:hypothetical protein NQ317_012051 [Molorchus minor]